MVRLFKLIELPSFNIQRGELALDKKKFEKLLGIAVTTSVSFLLYTKTGIQPIIESLIDKTLFSIPILGAIFQIDYIKIGLIAALLYYLKDIVD